VDNINKELDDISLW